MLREFHYESNRRNDELDNVGAAGAMYGQDAEPWRS